MGVDFPGNAIGSEECKCTSCHSTSTRARRLKLLKHIFLAAVVLGLVLAGAQAVIICRTSKMKHSVPIAKASSKVTQRVTNTMNYRLPTILPVGGSGAVWAIPATPSFYEKWGASVSIRPGDVLRFNKPNSTYIDEVPASSYRTCSNAGYYNYWTTTGLSELFIQIDAGAHGDFYFLDDDPALCNMGMRLSGSVSTLAYPEAPKQPPTTTKLQGRVAQEFEVGGTGKPWVLPLMPDYFINWASNISFRVGDTLRFNINSKDYEVSQVPYTSFELCMWTGYQWFATSSAKTFTFNKPGLYYFVASQPQYCIQGMRFTANVYNSNGTLDNETETGSGSGSGSGSGTGLLALKIGGPPGGVLFFLICLRLVLLCCFPEVAKKWAKKLPKVLQTIICCYLHSPV